MAERTDARTDARTDERTDERTDARTDERTEACANAHTQTGAQPHTQYAPLPVLPMRLHGIFGVSLVLMKRGFFPMLALMALLLFIPVLLTGLVLYRVIDLRVTQLIHSLPVGETLYETAKLFSLLFLFTIINAFLLTPLLNGAVYLEMHRRMRGFSGSFKELFRYALPQGMKRLYPVHMARLLIGMGMGLAVLVVSGVLTPLFTVGFLQRLMPEGMPGVAFWILSALLIAIVFVLCALGELFPSLTLPAAIQDGHRGFFAVGRSLRVTAGLFGRALGATILFYLILFAAGIPLACFFLYMLGLQSSGGVLLALALLFVFFVFAVPYTAAFRTALYADLSSRANAKQRDRQAERTHALGQHSGRAPVYGGRPVSGTPTEGGGGQSRLYGIRPPAPGLDNTDQ